MPRILNKHFRQVAVIRDEKSSNTDGGTSSTAYAARQLNVLEDPFNLVQNPSTFTGVGGTGTQFTLGPGTYYFQAAVPGYGSTSHKSRLRNITNSTTQLQGTNTAQAAGVGVTSYSHIKGTFTLTSTCTFEVQQRHTVAIAAGLGAQNNYGDNEVYTIIEIEKLA